MLHLRNNIVKEKDIIVWRSILWRFKRSKGELINWFGYIGKYVGEGF